MVKWVYCEFTMNQQSHILLLGWLLGRFGSLGNTWSCLTRDLPGDCGWHTLEFEFLPSPTSIHLYGMFLGGDTPFGYKSLWFYVSKFKPRNHLYATYRLRNSSETWVDGAKNRAGKEFGTWILHLCFALDIMLLSTLMYSILMCDLPGCESEYENKRTDAFRFLSFFVLGKNKFIFMYIMQTWSIGLGPMGYWIL